MIYPTLEEAQAAMGVMPNHNIDGLSPVQQELYHSYERIVEIYGQFDWSTGANGSHYAPAEANPFVNEGLVCSNCVYYANNACEIVQGVIDPNAICKFWIIPESKLQGE